MVDFLKLLHKAVSKTYMTGTERNKKLCIVRKVSTVIWFVQKFPINVKNFQEKDKMDNFIMQVLQEMLPIFYLLFFNYFLMLIKNHHFNWEIYFWCMSDTVKKRK